MPRYVILRHDWPAPHFDLLLESGEVLKAWRLLAEPVPGEWVPAEPNADHRPFYLDYEGPVSGGRGTVGRYAAGVYEGGRERAGVDDDDGGNAGRVVHTVEPDALARGALPNKRSTPSGCSRPR